MNKNYITLVIIFLLNIVIGCKNKTSNKITISGSISESLHKIEGRKLYLIDLEKKDVIKDSTVVKDYKFSFNLTSDSSFIPFRAKLSYRDTIRDPRILKDYGIKDFISNIRPLGIVNPYDSNFIESSFYVDEGETILTSLSSKSNNLTINGGKQNIPFYKHVTLKHLHDGFDSLRKAAMDYNKTIIRQYSYSYDLLFQLDKIKHGMTVQELTVLSDLFDKNMNAPARFKEYIDYISSKKTTNNSSYPYIELDDNKGVKTNLLDNSKFKLLIFWASWCGPCRAEIPTLKKIFAKYGTQGLSMVSVSIDNSKENWNLALMQEKMPWKQLIVSESEKPKIDAIFDIKSIPVMFLIDSQNQLVERIVGMDEETYKRIYKQIGTYLNN
jgi:thiol-disulfide isomerase/thioredoxin